MPTKLLTQKRLCEVLEYSPETGVFVWKVRRSSNAKIGDIAGHRHSVLGYIFISIDNKPYAAHQFAFLYTDGYLPENDVDHINGIGDDNRWKNLRHVSRSCNLQNCKLRADSTSGFMGVSWHKFRKKWVAYITVHKKRICIGYYTTIEKAALARCHFENECPDWTCNHLAVNRVKLRSMGYEI